MIGCLCIHGFTSAPYEVKPLADYLKEKTDWYIETPTLLGHGVEFKLEGVTYQDWIQHAERELVALSFSDRRLPLQGMCRV